MNPIHTIQCPVCDGTSVARSARGLELRVCEQCKLLWVVGGVENREHYEDKDAGAKKYSRERNARSQVAYAAKFGSLDFTCDVGCGDGTFVRILNESGYKGCFGIEPSIRARALANQVGVEVYAGGVETLSAVCAARQVRTVTLLHVLEHVAHPRDVLSQVYDALPEGGRIVIETPNSQAKTITRVSYEHDLVYPEHLYLFSQRSLELAVTMAGFKILGTGVRDFDDRELSIRQSLVRLGVLPYAPTKERMGVKHSGQTQKHNPQSSVYKYPRRLLNWAVRVLGLVDYQWLVAEKSH